MPTARRRSEEALARLGKETALDSARRMEQAGNVLGARTLREWCREDLQRLASLVACLPDTTGRGRVSERRELRVAMCGVAFLARRGSVVGFARRGCKDRICPTCGHRRRQRFVHALRRIVAERQFVGAGEGERCDVADDDASAALACEGLDPAGGCTRGEQLLQLPTAGDTPIEPQAPPQWDDVAEPPGTCRARDRGGFVQRRRLLFVTLTQPKFADEVTANGKTFLVARPAAEAVDRLLGCREDKGGAWRRFRHHARAWLLGGVRSLEITARRVNDMVGGHRVRVPGAHAHLHCILEVRGGTRASDVRAAWALACPGVRDRAIDVQELDDDNVYQVGSYCCETRKLLDMAKVDPSYVRDVLAALHGRRLVAAFGTWKVCDLGLREPKGDLVFGDRAVWTLTSSYEAQAPLVRWADGQVEDLVDVRVRFLEGPAAPIGGEPPLEKVPGDLEAAKLEGTRHARDGPLPAGPGDGTRGPAGPSS